MKEKAEVAEKYSDFDALLMSRPKIVLGMGIRQFFRFFNKKNQWTIAIGILLYLLVFLQVVSIALLGFTYPCDENVIEETGNVEKDCRTIEFYQGFSKMLVILIACIASSGLISNDLKNDSIHLYLSRPISRTDYLVARFIPIFLLLMISGILLKQWLVELPTSKIMLVKLKFICINYYSKGQDSGA